MVWCPTWSKNLGQYLLHPLLICTWFLKNQFGKIKFDIRKICFELICSILLELTKNIQSKWFNLPNKQILQVSMLNEDLENYTQLESRMQLRKIMIEKLYCMLYSKSFKLPHNKHLKNINLVAHFLLLTFFDKINFQITLFPKMMPNFLHLPITPILKVK